jgi:O-antigen/teichoic acid export membrane protein
MNLEQTPLVDGASISTVATDQPNEASGERPGTGTSLAHSIGKNTLFGVLARVVQVATRLVTVPVVIGHLGLGGYGIWSIIMTASVYMRFGSVGIKSAFQKYVAEATGSGNFQQANRLLSTGSAAMLVLSLAGLIPISLFSRSVAVALGVPAEFLKSTAGAISMLAVIMVLSNIAAAYEAIIMGGHRIDLARKFATFFSVAEAVGIIIALRLGMGLFAMATVMGLSEVGYVACCYVLAKKVVPEIEVSRKYVTREVLPELVRYAGSYQLVNVMEVIYAAIIPVALLRVFGDEAAGVYALANRLQASALMLPDAFLLPILSGGAKVYHSGSTDEMNRLITKSFKVTMALSLLPLAFLVVFGTKVIYAWTGQAPEKLQVTLLLLCATGFFYSFSLLALVLYRTSGKALHDNLRQLLRILMLLSVAVFAGRVGYWGVLAGLACAELFGLVFMLYAISKTYTTFRLQSLLPQSMKLVLTTAIALGAGIAISHIPLPASHNDRLLVTARLALAIAGCVFAAGPALWLTKSVTAQERNAFFHAIIPRKFRGA